MDHVPLFLVNLSFSLIFAALLGTVAKRLHLSPIIGYLITGIALGPYTPGFVGDRMMARDLAELGIILLMFGVGLHFRFQDLLAVRRTAVPGSIAQIAASWILGTVIAHWAGMTPLAALVMGLSVSIASTVVVVRVLADNDLLQDPEGHVAVGWLILQDIFTVFVLVMLPIAGGISRASEAGAGNALGSLAWALARFAALAVFVGVVGRKVIPGLLHLVARTRSRELFTLTILATALGIATGSAAFFGVSMALGAFLAGVVVGQTEVSHQAAADAIPMRDAFAVLFFVSVGMLFDPEAVIRNPYFIVGILGIILVATPIAAFAALWVLRSPVRTALTTAAALGQIGEFSFLLANEAIALGILAERELSILVTCSVLAIAVNPFLFRALPKLEER
ncbi:MAG TPA: cation:proton antiporter, partial [Thermodesulfobacteriota bacterium]|nr:cation:proton antiporter [Thermodesulfobacteriota bacterium]